MATRAERERVRAVFEDVLTTYFPRWKAGPTWSIRIETQSPYTNERGRCVPERRLIAVNPSMLERSPAELEELLVHECCHAVTTPAHEGRWSKRMQSAASRAAAVGRGKVAELIRKELELHAEAAERGVGGLAELEALVQDVLLDCPELTFDQVVRFLCAELVLPRKVLQGRFPSLHSLYRKKKTECVEIREAERAWAEARAQQPED